MTTDYVIAIDLGGTKIAAALADRDGHLSLPCRTDTPAHEGGAAVVGAINALVGEVRSQAHKDGIDRIVGVGIGSAGVVDLAGQRIIASTDAIRGWAGTEVVSLVESAVNLPVTLENDVNAHLRGEAWKGAGAGKNYVAMMALGTGIGGALMINGEILVGPHGTAGDFGHLPTLLPTKRACTCGRGVPHLETVASGPGLYAWYLENGGDPVVGGARELEKRALSGDALAARIYTEVAAETGRALGSIVNTVDPEVMIVGGGLANSTDIWWKPLRAAYQEQLVNILREVPLVKATLGNAAALVGAAKKIWNRVDG